MNDTTMYAFFWLCGAAVFLGITAAIGYNYHENTLSRERLIGEYGIDPIILECADTDLKQNGTMSILCMEALKKYKIDQRDITKLKALIDKQ